MECLELVDLAKLAKSINNTNNLQKNNNNIVYYRNFRTYHNLSYFFLFEIIFLTHSSMDFIVFGHLIDFEILRFLTVSGHFLAFVTNCINISKHIFLILSIITPFLPNFLLQPSKHRPKFIEFLLFASKSRSHGSLV